MRRTMLTLVATLAIIVAGPKSFSQDGDGGTNHQDIVNNYYSDDSYAYCVGWDERYCGNAFASDGSDTIWRYHQVFSCDGVELWSSCQTYQGGSWTSVQCPDEGVTAQVRIRIPVG